MTNLKLEIYNEVYNYLSSPENKQKIIDSITSSLNEAMAPLIGPTGVTQEEVDERIDSAVSSTMENMEESWVELSEVISRVGEPLQWTKDFKDILIRWSDHGSEDDLRELTRSLLHG